MVLRRVALTLLQLLFLSLFVFILAEFMPGDALTGRITPSITGERLAEMRVQMGLDRPWPVRYAEWVTGVLRGDLGESYTHMMPVSRLIAEKFGNTLRLALFSAAVCFGVSVPLGLLAGVKPGSLTDKAVSGGSYILMSTPQAVFGVLAIFVFSYALGWFPAAGSISGGMGRLRHLILPGFTSAMFSIPVLTQLVRAEAVSALNSGYVYALRARGLSERRIFWAHVLRGSLLPAASLAGSLVATLLGGSALVESVFSYPGIGKLFVDSVLGRDYPAANALILLAAALAAFGTLFSDIAMHMLDPRVKMR